MTLYGLIASLAWTATAVLCISRLDAFGARWLALVVPSKAQPPGPVVIPADLVALAQMETEPWAQDSVLATIRERWETYHDWNTVRRAVGVGEVDG